MDTPIRKLFDPASLPARDAYGWVTHPDLTRFYDHDAADDLIYIKGLKEAGWQSESTHLEYDDRAESQVVQNAYFEEGEMDVTAWNPPKPTGEGWLLAGIWEAEDGPCAFWVRPQPQEAA